MCERTQQLQANIESKKNKRNWQTQITVDNSLPEGIPIVSSYGVGCGVPVL